MDYQPSHRSNKSLPAPLDFPILVLTVGSTDQPHWTPLIPVIWPSELSRGLNGPDAAIRALSCLSALAKFRSVRGGTVGSRARQRRARKRKRSRTSQSDRLGSECRGNYDTTAATKGARGENRRAERGRRLASPRLSKETVARHGMDTLWQLSRLLKRNEERYVELGIVLPCLGEGAEKQLINWG